MKKLEIIEDILGEDFLEELEKAELYKPSTNTVVSHEEMADALNIVPKAIISWLSHTLTPMEVNGVETFQLPFKRAENSSILVNKLASDVYSGEIIKDNEVVYRFKYRSIPGLGLVILTTFELYDINDASPSILEENKEKALSDMIDDKVKLRSMIEDIVEEKISQKEAVGQIISMSLEDKKDKKLKSYLDKKKLNKTEKSYSFHLLKAEEVNCPDCGQNLYDGKNLNGCLCYGQDMGRKVFLKKKEDNSYIVKFSKGWDEENISIFLKVLKRRKNG